MTTDNKFRPQQYFGATRPIKNLGSSRDFVRIASLGGFGDVTQNLFVYEYFPSGNEAQSQIIIVDCGVGFPEDDAFGVDLQIPDTKYLEDRKNRILGIFITHGHEDHIGAIRFILPILGKSIPIFAPKIAAALIESRLQESQIRANLKVYQNGDLFNVGSFTVDPIRVNHSIPDTFHFAITTPIGIFYHGSDFKFDVFPLDGKPSDLATLLGLVKRKSSLYFRTVWEPTTRVSHLPNLQLPKNLSTILKLPKVGFLSPRLVVTLSAGDRLLTMPNGPAAKLLLSVFPSPKLLKLPKPSVMSILPTPTLFRLNESKTLPTPNLSF